MGNLTDQQKLFVKHYLKLDNAAEAARIAGYRGSNLKEIGRQLLANKKIVSALYNREPEVTVVNIKRKRRGADDLIDNLWDIVDFDVSDVATYNGSNFAYKPFAEWPTGATKAVLGATVKEFKDGSVITEFRFENKIKAIDKIGQYEGIWAGFDQLVAGLKNYGIELERDGDRFLIKQAS